MFRLPTGLSSRVSLAATVFLVSLIPMLSSAQESSPPYETFKDVPYANEGRDLLLDLYIPNGVSEPFLMVWVHGGRWSRGSKDSVPLLGLAESGYAMASIDYRLSGEARFPAQIHDIKAAIRFLRAVAPKYGYRVDRVAVGGSSAGGHLAALVGTTNGHSELEGQVGEHLDQSSSVQAIVDLYGPTNFATILDQSTPHGLSVRVPALELLLGDGPDLVPDLAELASPVAHVDGSDPPLLILHGDQDPQVPINQSHELHGAYERYGLKVQFEVIHGAAHGGEAFSDPTRLELVREFLDNTLRDGRVSDAKITR